ncbi:DUF4393 domain-containing protein [Staphylococcus simiae]|uniref:DUF4393 domain-containing protein n=1 Tax=Staphylococcus simiae TaxID=308354 RepID=UPI001A965246|nr:DUF4393 domain-containing protein [Staphylococcus simiae]MBO1199093.1 DUF4393 domain-containing protein [Staphylococcus simiae]MBO1201199.1 DUF4393 domain-containing protein [Staphylococcus simiae]MBO1203347.1 DUF4393 domain-containing protein [Staphylococcus simiae]MBO1210875.1 DUF4393 domain-containing protein [Staphylococcus simiae]MBO1229531.1 DUF4393 domain-containing protein [Staphylococcus simiae]
MDQFLFTFVNKLIEKGAAKGPIKTFSKTWDLIFGKFHFYVDKIQYKRELDFERFKMQFKDEISNVPEENLKEPQISLLGPALEASKFYIDEQSLSNMFAKLIASSMDNRKSSLTHHSFVEVIKQLSPNDAVLLKHLSTSNIHPTAKYRAVVNSSNDGFNISDSLIKNSPIDIQQTELAINNLIRLGILSDSSGLSSLTKEGVYDAFYSPRYFEHFSQFIFNMRTDKNLEFVKDMLRAGFTLEQISNKTDLNYENLISFYKPWVIDIEKGYIQISAYGQAFVNTCIN